MNKMQGQQQAIHPQQVSHEGGGEDPKARLRSSRSVPPQAYTQMQKGGAVSSINHAGIPPGVFGRKSKWGDQQADEEALQQQQQHPMGGNPQHQLQNIVPMNMRQNGGRHMPYVLPNAALLSKPPSPIDPLAHVKFVNSTVENLQSQIKKEEAPKKKRTRTSPEQLRILQKAFATDPMPSSQARLALSKKLGMNPRAVQVWFQNRRAKAKRCDGMPGQEDDEMGSCGSGSEDDLVHNSAGHHQHDPNAARNLHHYHQSGRMHDQSRSKSASNRAASMSSLLPIGYAPNPSALDNGYFSLTSTAGSNNPAAFFDPSSFMDPVESAFSGEMVLPGLDFSMYGGYGAAVAPPCYSMPMQGMFSLPPGSYDVAGQQQAQQQHNQAHSQAQATVNVQDLGLMRGYGGYQMTQGHYPSFTDETNLGDDVLSRFNSVDEHGFGPINPLSALLDAHSLESRQYYGLGKDDMSLNSNNNAGAAGQQVMQGQPQSRSQSPPNSMRRSYSLNDIHSQLTTQQIQTLESVGLPALGQGPTKTTLGCIREEDDQHLQRQSSGSPDFSTASGVVDQDQLLSTIDDLRMGAFWDTTAPES